MKQPFDRHDLVKHYKTMDGTKQEKQAKIKDLLILESYKERYETKTDIEINEQIKQDQTELQEYREAQIQIKEHTYCLEHATTLEQRAIRKKINECKNQKEPRLPYQEYSINNQVDLITTDNPPPRAGYEGAIVLDPEPGIYLDDPVGVVDYASLYPSSIIEKNIHTIH